MTTPIRRSAVAAGLIAATLGICAIGVTPAAAATQPAPQSTSVSAQRSSAEPGAPTTGPTRTGTAEVANQSATRAGQKAPANNVIDGTSLKVTNTTGGPVAVTFMYDGQAGGQANWTWLNPGQSATASNSTMSGPDIWNSYLYFPSNNKQVKFESKRAGWSCATTITVNGDETGLDRGQQASKSVEGHNYTAGRGQTDITLPMTDWIDGQPTVRPDMGLTFTN